uniref:Uncharacterized protein n=1 Tax=Anguilla anguilla TaxID=7936 RepID=A0A0E9PHH4_ANGAN
MHLCSILQQDTAKNISASYLVYQLCHEFLVVCSQRSQKTKSDCKDKKDQLKPLRVTHRQYTGFSNSLCNQYQFKPASFL